MKIRTLAAVVSALLASSSCVGRRGPAPEAASPLVDERTRRAEAAMATLPADVAGSVSTAINADAERFFTLLEAAESESAAAGDLLVLVDKRHPIPAEYEPDDLVLITEYGLSASRDSLLLRQAIIPALLEMDAAAKSEGIELLFSSAYRSYDYQATLFERYRAQYGEQEASRFSARPGTSQHQLGTAMDFGSIDDSFAATEAGLWLGRNAGTYGFSL
ncbi:MAG: M15 family metallopeptidase, partial [Spirochaetales bacterium]|nr:M15 family metallopeptidase [Spirochaetales bacterium]